MLHFQKENSKIFWGGGNTPPHDAFGFSPSMLLASQLAGPWSVGHESRHKLGQVKGL